MRRVKEVHTGAHSACVDSYLRPSCVEKGGGGGWMYESEMSAPSIRRIS